MDVDPEFHRVLEAPFRDHGFICDSAFDAARGLEKLESEHFDLVIVGGVSDMDGMDDMDGDGHLWTNAKHATLGNIPLFLYARPA